MPTGANQRLRYAYTGVPGTNTGAQNAGSAAGNLRDTDPYPSLYGNTLYNWAVHFDEAITLDSTAPSVSSVVSAPSDTSVTITWTTDEASSSIIDYGLTNSYGTTTSEADTSPRVTSHSVTLSSLVACTTYNYRVKSNDAASNLATGSNATFTTTGCTGDAAVESENQASIANASGGSVSLLDSSYGLALTVPAGATNTDSVFQIKKLNKNTTLATTSTPGSKSLMGTHVYELKSLGGVSSSNTSFNSGITVTVIYSDSDVSGYNESSLQIYRYSSGSWSALSDCSVNTATNTITCTTTHFSTFGLFGSSSSVSSRSGSSGTSAQVRYNNLLAINNTKKAEELKKEFPNKIIATTSGVFKFTKILKQNVIDSEVKELQKYLNSKGYTLAQTGPGSPGNETTKFGPLTKKAVIKFQLANRLTADGVVGQKTREIMK